LIMIRATPPTKNMLPGRGPFDLTEYEKAGGYRALRRALKKMTPAVITEMVIQANLLGRGGAGFSTGRKWSFVPMDKDAPEQKYVVCNFDEMEPGSFKDRYLVEGDPHQLVEGMILSAFAIEAGTGYIFLRKDYGKVANELDRAIKEAYAKKYLGRNIMGSRFSFDLHIHVSAGRYICGEDTALLNALEGSRGIPRTKPPHTAEIGLWGKPTVVNNAETLCNIPHIVSNGAEWYRSLSYTEEGGTKIYGISGRVNRPGAWELPMGTTMREILEIHAGGMKSGLKFRGAIPGGASSAFVTEEHLDVPMDFASMKNIGSQFGTGTIVVLDDGSCPVGMVLNLQSFFSRESCGWCTPCREGLPWIVRMLAAIEEGNGTAEDIGILEEHTHLMQQGNTFCTLAPAAMFSLGSALRHFREDFEKHISMKICPWKK
jgi:NADH-quinone oxidoreductase subunit F